MWCFGHSIDWLVSLAGFLQTGNQLRDHGCGSCSIFLSWRWVLMHYRYHQFMNWGWICTCFTLAQMWKNNDTRLTLSLFIVVPEVHRDVMTTVHSWFAAHFCKTDQVMRQAIPWMLQLRCHLENAQNYSTNCHLMEQGTAYMQFVTSLPLFLLCLWTILTVEISF